MANYTILKITVFGEYKDLVNFDLNPPKIDSIDLEISSNFESRHIYSWFNSKFTSEVINSIINQIINLTLLVEIEMEPGYNSLLYLEKNSSTPKMLFEIPDFRDDSFFESIDAEYLKNFEKISLSKELIEEIYSKFIGKTYLHLLINQ